MKRSKAMHLQHGQEPLQPLHALYQAEDRRALVLLVGEVVEGWRGLVGVGGGDGVRFLGLGQGSLLNGLLVLQLKLGGSGGAAF